MDITLKRFMGISKACVESAIIKKELNKKMRHNVLEVKDIVYVYKEA